MPNRRKKSFLKSREKAIESGKVTNLTKRERKIKAAK